MDEKTGGKMRRRGDEQVDEGGAGEGGRGGRITDALFISKNSSNDDKWNQMQDLTCMIREQCYDARNIHEKR